MNSLLPGNYPISVFVIVFLAVLVLLWRVLFPPSKRPAKKTARNWIDGSESGCDDPEASLYSTGAGGNPDSASVAASSAEYAPEPNGIVAEVCSLKSPAREDVEQSYRGRRVRWTLSVTAISEREGAGASHIVRMYPSGRSPYSCGVYFMANAVECAVLQAAGKNESFVIEGTIDKIEDRDIDLTDVRMVEKAA